MPEILVFGGQYQEEPNYVLEQLIRALFAKVLSDRLSFFLEKRNSFHATVEPHLNINLLLTSGHCMTFILRGVSDEKYFSMISYVTAFSCYL